MGPNKHLLVQIRNTKKRCEICLTLTTNTAESRSGVFIVKCEHISHDLLVFLLLAFLCEYYYQKCKDKQVLYFSIIQNCSRFFQ